LKKFFDGWGVARVWAARALDRRHLHLPSEAILTREQLYFTEDKRKVLDDAANAAVAANAQSAVTALEAARVKADQERQTTAQLALASAREMVAIATTAATDAITQWRGLADLARADLVLSETMVAGALARLIQATVACNGLAVAMEAAEEAQPNFPTLVVNNVPEWARLANVTAAAAVVALAEAEAADEAADVAVTDGLVQAMRTARALNFVVD